MAEPVTTSKLFASAHPHINRKFSILKAYWADMPMYGGKNTDSEIIIIIVITYLRSL